MAQVNLSRLQSQLLTSGIQQSNNALYQVITQLLFAVQQIQNASSSSSVIPTPTEVDGYWTPLTDGDLDETDLIFSNGDAIMVFIPV